MESAEQNVRTPRSIVVSDLICPVCVGDIDLNDHQVGLVVKVELLDVFVLERYFEVGIEISGKSCQTKRRKERVLDGPPIGTCRLSQRGQNQLDASERSFQGRLLSGRRFLAWQFLKVPCIVNSFTSQSQRPFLARLGLLQFRR